MRKLYPTSKSDRAATTQSVAHGPAVVPPLGAY